MIGVLDFEVNDIGNGLYELVNPVEINIFDWDGKRECAGYTAFGYSVLNNKNKFVIMGYCKRWNCGVEVTEYMI